MNCHWQGKEIHRKACTSHKRCRPCGTTLEHIQTVGRGHTLILRTRLLAHDTSLHMRSYMTSGCNWELALSQEYVLRVSVVVFESHLPKQVCHLSDLISSYEGQTEKFQRQGREASMPAINRSYTRCVGPASMYKPCVLELRKLLSSHCCIDLLVPS